MYLKTIWRNAINALIHNTLSGWLYGGGSDDDDDGDDGGGVGSGWFFLVVVLWLLFSGTFMQNSMKWKLRNIICT